MNSLMIDIQNELLNGELSFQEIARLFDVPVDWVESAAKELNEQDYDDSMDGDAASALASVGWGCDEDYVVDNDYFDDF